MQSFLPRRVYRGSAPHLLVRLFLAGTVVVLVACEADDPAPDAATATDDTPDASVRDLPGDGLEPTPEIGVNRPRGQRPNLIEALGDRDAGPTRPSQPDAAPPDAGDASDANGPI